MQEQDAWEAAADRRRRSWLLLAVAAVAAVAVAVWPRAEGRDGTLPIDAATPAPAAGADASFETAAGVWTNLGEVPVSPSADHRVLWTGRELLIWGGEGSFAAFDPGSARWREAQPAPVHPDGLPPVWTGTEALVWGRATDGGGRGLAGAAYAPGSDTWRLLPEGPLPTLRSGVAAWTGREALIWGRWGRRGLKGGATYDPDARRWQTLRLGPVPRVTAAGGVWTGRSLVVWGTTGNEIVVWGPRDPAANPGPPRVTLERFAAVYSPTEGRWRLLPSPPLADPAAAAATWTGHEVVLLGEGESEDGLGPLTAVAIDPHDRPGEWRTLPPAPQPDRRDGLTKVPGLQGAWTGERLLALVGPELGWVYDPGTERWQLLPEAAAATRGTAAALAGIAWTGDRLLVVVTGTGGVDLLAWQPE